MPQTQPAEKSKEAVTMAPLSTNRSGLLGHLSRMLIALLNTPSLPSLGLPDREGPPDAPTRRESLTNNRPAHSRGGFDLARGMGYATHERSLDNMLSHRPARPHALIEKATSLSANQETSPIKEIKEFYLFFLAALVSRQEDARDVDLQQEVQKALDSVAFSIPESERWLLPAGDWQRPELLLSLIDNRMVTGEIAVPETGRVKEIYIHALHGLLARLEEQLDDSMVRLLFRLAARDAMREKGEIAVKYSLLEGIPDIYLRQPGPSLHIQEDTGE